MKIAVIGSGYVGLVAAACFAELGHSVICVDNDEAKLAALNRGETPIHERFLPELLARHRDRGLSFSASLFDSVRQSQIVFIAVGTPSSESGEADLSYVEAVSRDIARAIVAGDGHKVIVEKSTVPVHTCDGIRRVMKMNGAPPECFDVVSNPEFLREGTAVTDFLYPDRIVIGSEHEPSLALLREVYAPLTEGTYYRAPGAVPRPHEARICPSIIATSTKSAELIKHASNAFLAMKISFINAVATICEAAGADVSQVRAGVGSDSRIGEKFLLPGIGYGGSCFPKDAKAFSAVARECGYEFRLLDEVMQINEEQRLRFMRKVRSALWTLKGKRVGVLGLAFKGGTDDIRESPAIALVQELIKEECRVIAYDPAAMERTKASGVLSKKIAFAESAYEAATDADALLILTDWDEFASLDLQRLRSVMRYPILVDGRNLYSLKTMAAAGFNYVSVGRPDVLSAKPEILKAAEVLRPVKVSHRAVRITINPAISRLKHQRSGEYHSE